VLRYAHPQPKAKAYTAAQSERVTCMPDLKLTSPAEATSVGPIRNRVANLAESAGFEEQALQRIRLAVSEACTNVVLHAYDARGVISVTASTCDRGLRVVVRDEGRGIKPRVDSPGLGLGLPLIAASCDHVDLINDSGPGGELRMYFRALPHRT
jgi:anti-sigma regulatory factor (Ser/Thr protein kinase)